MDKEEKEKVTSGKFSREFSAGGVVFKKVENKFLYLITKSMPSDLYPNAIWRLPKGWIDEGESTQDTAIREVGEEGGVDAKIIVKIDNIKFVYTHPIRGKVFKVVTFYLMEWISDRAEGFDQETSEIKWATFEEAMTMLHSSNEKQVLKKSQSLI